MTTRNPTLSICIPSYNRPAYLGNLLDTIAREGAGDYEVVICDNASPNGEAIRSIVSSAARKMNVELAYFENETNLGFDGNIRQLLHKARGAYCCFMGDDDLLCEGAIPRMLAAVQSYPNVGVVLRSYLSFMESPGKITQTFKYFDSERFFPAGPQSVITFFRRSVVLSGMVLHRNTAVKLDTDRFDGTLLYQLYLVGSIVMFMNGVYLPTPTVLYRMSGTPEFGRSLAERGKYIPGKQTPQSSLAFVGGMLNIAQHLDKSLRHNLYDAIVKDVGNYAYPLLSIQCKGNIGSFLSYARRLAAFGLWRTPPFFFYLACLLMMGPELSDKVIAWMKSRRGVTPNIGNVYSGVPGHTQKVADGNDLVTS